MREQPADIETERAVLGALLLDNERIPDVIPILPDAGAFYHPPHKLLYGAILGLFNHGQEVDLVTLRDHLDRAGHMNLVGGADTLAALVDGAAVSSGAEHYAKIVRDHAMRRALIIAGEHIAELGYDKQADLDGSLINAGSWLYAIHLNYGWKRSIRIGQVLEGVMRELALPPAQRSGGVSSGFRHLDSVVLGFRRGELTILAARTSIGKSTLALNVARAITAAGHPVIVYTTMDSEGARIPVTCCTIASGNWSSWKRAFEAMRSVVDAVPQLRYCPHCGTKYPEQPKESEK